MEKKIKSVRLKDGTKLFPMNDGFYWGTISEALKIHKSYFQDFKDLLEIEYEPVTRKIQVEIEYDLQSELLPITIYRALNDFFYNEVNFIVTELSNEKGI